MKTLSKQLLFWIPRILTILFAGFISLFALDVFQEGMELWDAIGALLVHLIPTFILIVLLLMSWRWEWIVGSVFIILGLVYMIINFDYKQWIIAISGPMLLIGILYLLDWNKRKSKANNTKTMRT